MPRSFQTGGIAALTLTALVVALVAAMSLDMLPIAGLPTIIAPAPVLLVIPGFLGVPPALLPLLAACLCAMWCPQIAHGTSVVPLRTLVLSSLTAVGSVWWFVAGWTMGVQYEGRAFVHATAIISTTLMLLTASALYYGRKHPTLGATTFAHTLLFSWLFSYAFPYLGETP